MSLNFIALSSTSFQITLQLLLQIIKHVQILVFSVDVSKFPQKLEVSNKTNRRSQVFLHF
jgi:hypothetical protein